MKTGVTSVDHKSEEYDLHRAADEQSESQHIKSDMRVAPSAVLIVLHEDLCSRLGSCDHRDRCGVSVELRAD